MSESTTNRQQINAPFRVKSAGGSLVVIVMIGAYYFANVFELLASEENLPDGALSLAITALILMIVAEVVLQIVLFLGAGKIEDRIERGDAVSARSASNAYLVLSAGVLITFSAMFARLSPFEMGNLLLLAFLLAEIVKFGSQIVYYRRSA